MVRMMTTIMARLGERRTAAFSGQVTTITRSVRSARMINVPESEALNTVYMNTLHIIFCFFRAMISVSHLPWIVLPAWPIRAKVSATARAPMYTLELTARFCFFNRMRTHSIFPMMPIGVTVMYHQKRKVKKMSTRGSLVAAVSIFTPTTLVFVPAVLKITSKMLEFVLSMVVSVVTFVPAIFLSTVLLCMSLCIYTGSSACYCFCLPLVAMYLSFCLMCLDSFFVILVYNHCLYHVGWSYVMPASNCNNHTIECTLPKVKAIQGLMRYSWNRLTACKNPPLNLCFWNWRLYLASSSRWCCFFYIFKANSSMWFD